MSNFMMIRVTVPGYMGTVSFHPISFSAGAITVTGRSVGKCSGIKGFTVDELSIDEMDVHRMDITRSVVDLPHFSRTGFDLLLGRTHCGGGARGRRIILISCCAKVGCPKDGIGISRVLIADNLDEPAILIVVFIQGQFAHRAIRSLTSYIGRTPTWEQTRIDVLWRNPLFRLIANCGSADPVGTQLL